jgi:hypothetical protein
MPPSWDPSQGPAGVSWDRLFWRHPVVELSLNARPPDTIAQFIAGYLDVSDRCVSPAAALEPYRTLSDLPFSL